MKFVSKNVSASASTKPIRICYQFSNSKGYKFCFDLTLFISFQSSSYSNVTPGGAIVVTATGATPFSTPTTVCSGGGPPRPFPSATYGPPPGATIIPPGTVTPTPSSHGPSPTPSSGSGGGGFANHPPGYRRTNKLGRMGPNSRTPLGVTPPTSPAKNSRGKGKFCIFLKYSLLSLLYFNTISQFHTTCAL